MKSISLSKFSFLLCLAYFLHLKQIHGLPQTLLSAYPGPYATSGTSTRAKASSTRNIAIFNGALEKHYNVSNSFKSYGKSWVENIPVGIVFIYANDFYDNEITNILKAAEQVRQSSCIPVVVKPLTEFMTSDGRLVASPYFKNYVFIQKTFFRPCWSRIGMQGGEQLMYLNTNTDGGCTSKPGYIVHEMLHSLGYDHEHDRRDRNSFVAIHFPNIQPGDEANFQINGEAPIVGSYDYNSVLHYPAYARAIDPTYPTISSNLVGYTVPEEQSAQITETDRYKIKIATGCVV